MHKRLQTFCLVAAGPLVFAAVFLLGTGGAASTGSDASESKQPTRLTSQPAADSVGRSKSYDAPAGVRLAWQQPNSSADSDVQHARSTDAGWAGVMLGENEGRGVKVVDVFPAGPAAFAGLRAGDVLLKIGDTTLDSTKKAAAVIEGLAPNQTASVTIQRGKQSLELQIPIQSLRDFHGRYVREMLRRDPRDPKYGERHGVSHGDMQAEFVRRLFEQNQRLETKMTELLEEVHALRVELHGRSK